MPAVKNITTEFEAAMVNSSKKFAKSKMNSANEKYNQLVATGVLKKRGYTLRGIEDAHLYSVRLGSLGR